jgi:putative holliday junction resolvase
MGKFLAIDYGLARVGIAISDENHKIAFARPALKFKDDIDLVTQIRNIVEVDDIELVVLGRPLHLFGDKSELCDTIENFAKMLVKNCAVKVDFIDERMSSLAADNYLHQAGKSPSRNKDLQNSLAAQIILQNYLDKFNNQNELAEDE